MTAEQQILAALVRPLDWTGDGVETWSKGSAPRYHISQMAAWGCQLHYGNVKIGHPKGDWHPTLEAAQAAAWEHYLSTQSAALDLGKVVALVEASKPFSFAVMVTNELNSRSPGDRHRRPHEAVTTREFQALSTALADLGVTP